MDRPLDELIVETLTKPGTSDAAAEVHVAAVAEQSRLSAEADAADKASLSPLATSAQAHQLRGRATELRFEMDRMDASVTALTARVDELEKAEARTVREAEHRAAKAERDELAADVARLYPAIAGTLTRLVKRIIESDARCARVGIHESAEAIGRGVPATFRVRMAPLIRLENVIVPMPSEDAAAWEPAGAYGGAKYRGLELPEIKIGASGEN